MQNSIISAVKILTAVIAVALSPAAFGVANYVYHERTGNDMTDGNPTVGCTGPLAYLPLANPSSTQSNFLRFKVEYQFFTDTTRVYYTTDGSSPSGSKGVASGTTVMAVGAFECTFSTNGNTIDIWNATIPAQTAGTVVKYIIGAWHSGGGDEIFANSGTCGGCGNFNDSSLATVFQYTAGSETDLYWDSNGATAGAGATPTGTWGSSTFWNTVSDGTGTPGAWTANRNAIFSAGSDASSAFTVTVTGTQTPGNMTVEEGTVSIAGGTVAMGNRVLTVNSGATLSTDSSLRMTASVGSTATLSIDGGTVRTTNPGAAGTFMNTNFAMVFGPGGATLTHATANILNIIQVQTPGVTITGPGSLTKNGLGVLAIAATGAWGGGTTINEGELRIRSTANRLPTTTAVTVNSPGILNLNGVSQAIGSLSGNGDVGLGAGTLTVGDATSTTYTGALKNIANAGASGVTTGAGRVIKNGAGTLTLTGLNSYTGSLTVNNGAVTVASGATLCDPLADIVIQGGALNLDNAAQTILTLAGNGGAVNLGTGHTLTVNPSNTRTNASTIGGAGALSKTGAGTLVLAGDNSYGGGTTIGNGTIRVSNGAGSATGSGQVSVLAGGTLTGGGSVAGAVVVDGRISPGASPGTLNTGAETWSGGGIYTWEINDVDAGVGVDPGWDLINITGGLTINATAGSKFNINITSLTSSSVAGDVADFDNTQDYVWTILKTTGGITGFDPAAINLNAAAFSNPLGNGLFLVEVANAGNDLVLRFVRTPAIATAPVGGAAECTSNFTFSVTATGTEPLAYQWKHAGTNLPGETASTLTVVANGQTAGSYVVDVSNAYGTASSAPVILAANDTMPPTITCGQNETVQCGAAWDFTVPTVSDACDANPAVTIVSTETNAACGNTFTATRIWQASDQALNSATCTQIVAVVDTTAPMITCAPNLSVECGEPWDFTAPTATDGCDTNTQTIIELSTVTNSVTGGYAVTRTWQATDACANSATCSQTISVLDTVAPTIACPADISVCTISNSALVNFAPVSTDACDATPNIICNPPSGTEFLVGTNQVSCTASDDAGNSTNCTFNVTVLQNTSAAGPSDSSVCTGGTITLSTVASGTGPFTYQWLKNGEILTDETNDSFTISVAASTNAGSYCVEVVGACNSATNCAALTVVDLVNAAGPDNTTACVGTSVTLTTVASGAGPFTYQWRKDGNALLNETNNALTLASVGPSDVAAYCVEVTGACASVTNCANVAVNPLPIVSVNSMTICAGQSALLTATHNAANPSFLWSPGGAITDSITVNPESTATYSVTVTDGTTTCSAGASGTVTVNPLPNVAVNSTTICTGQSATLTATTDASNPSYLWSPGGEITPSIVVSPTATATYSVMVTDGTTTCSAGASGTVTVNPLPSVAVNSTTICAGQPAVLTATTDASNPAYAWSPGGETTPSITVSPAATTTYTCTVTDGTTTCANSGSGTVTVNALPSASVNSPAICAGGSAELTATSDASNPSYLWSPGGATTVSITVSPGSTTTYTVTVTDGTTTCSANAQGTVTVNPLPVVSVNSVTVCDGGSATLTATTDAASPTYLWSPGGATTPSITVSPASTTTYTCAVTDGATTCSASGSGTVTVKGYDQFSNSGAITINDLAAGSPYPSAITVSGLTATVCRVTVGLNELSHDFPDDLDIALVGPNGEAVLLMSDVGNGFGISNLDLIFDDFASSSLPNATQIVGGTFKPSNIGAKADGNPDNFPAPAPTQRYLTNLSVFNGINPNGTWNLFVYDDELVDGGQIAGGWTLSFSTLNPIADVGISQLDVPDPVAVGSNLTYTVVVTNHGPAAASGVLVSDTPPSGVTLVSFGASQGSCTLVTGTIWCALGSIAANDSATVTVVVGPSAAGTIVNTASVQSDDVDFNSANNSSTASTTVLDPPVITTGPQSQVVCADTTVTFTVVATGEPPLSYQWYFGIDAISGATSDTLVIPNAQPAASGGYSVVVNNSVGATSASATLTVNPLPVVTVNSPTICVGQSAILTADNNASNPSYLWSPGGETTSSITVSPTTTTTYSVLVTDGTTSCTNSASGTVTVNQLTTASALTSITNACPGTTVSFSTTAGGTGPHSYVWRKDGAEIIGENGASLTFAAVAAGDAGTYCVEVTGVCDSVTNCATLTVATPPTIASQPQSISRPMGNSATFSVTANSSQPLTYQWQLNGADMPGETAATVTIPNLTLAQNGGQYSVIVSNCAGAVASATATLTVTPIAGISFDFNTPQFTNTPYNVQLNDWLHTALPSLIVETTRGGVGDTGALDLQGAADNSSIFHHLSYDFSQDGKTLVASVMIRIVAPANNFRNTQLAFITATNAYAGTAPGLTGAGVSDANPIGFMSVILQSTAQPALTYQLRLQHRRTDGGIAEVTPTPTPQATLTAGTWYKLVATFQNIKATAANTFTVSASLQDMGANGLVPGAVPMSYPAQNVVNTSIPNQRNMFLAVRTGRSDTGADFWDNIYAYATPGPLVFVAQPASQTVNQGGQATFQALVDGEGPYTYQWNKNGSPIPGAGNWKYMTAPARVSENGDQYTVSVTSPLGSITSDPATLTVQGNTLALVSVGSVDGCSIGAQFNQSVDGASAANPANYLINGSPAASARVYTSTVDPNPTRVVLTPAATLSGPYTVTVQNVNDLSGNPIGAANSAGGRIEGLVGVDINPVVAAPVGQNYSFAAGQFEIIGGGTDIFTAPDAFRYVHTQKSGDFDVKVRVPYQDVMRSPTKSGFNVRTSLDPAAPQVLASVNPRWPARGLYEGTHRQAFNVGGTSWGAAGTAVQYPNGWLRFRRVGNTFMRYSSQNGTTWQFDGQHSPSPAFPDTVYFGLAVCSVANNNAQTASFDGFGDFAGYPGATIAITTEPVPAATVVAGSSTNLTVTATITGAPGAGELSYVWQRHAGGGVWTNAVAAGQTNNTFNTGALLAPDNGAEYRVIVKAPGAADVISATTTVTVTDGAVPTITAAIIPVGSTHQVVITFSEAVSAATALNTANYTVTNSAAVDMGVASAVFLGSDQRVVVLNTVNALVAGTYGARISGVQDLAGNTMAVALRSLSQSANAPATGPVVVEFYGYLTNGGSIGDLTNNLVTQTLSPSAKFAADTPDFTVYSNVFGINPLNANFPDTLNHYGVQMYSYFVPPTSGAYKFYVRADDFAQFLMNTNAVGSTNPAGAVLQVSLAANAQAYTLANSVTNTLVAGQRYYMELRFKETTGGDGGTVAVRTDNTLPGQGEVIPATQLAFPDAVAKATPVVVELYTGQVTVNSQLPNDLGGAFGSGGYPDLLASMNTPSVIARNPNVIGYARYFGYNTNLAQATSQPNTVANNTFDNYLGRIYGNFVAPSNGLYKFYIRADDSAELWMNTNAVNSTDPAGISLLGFVNDFYDVNQRLVAQNVSLVGGQRYYMEGRWREGTGGDGMSVTFRAQSDLTLPANTEVLPGTRLEFPNSYDRVGPVDAVITPSSPIVSAGQTISFQAANLRGMPNYSFQWLKNGVPVQGNTMTFVTQPLTASDDGAVFTLVVNNAFSRVERSTTVTVVSDNTAPTILGAVGSQYQDLVVLTFSEALDITSACATPNYQVNNGLQVYSATLDQGTRQRVTLRTSPQTAGTTYTITVNSVRDVAGNAIAADTAVAFTAWVAAGHGFYVEYFTNIAGTAVANLVMDNKYLNNLPDVSYYTNRFGAGWFAVDTGLNNYGVRVTGLFSPPTNGTYQFYVRGDDGTQLFMNTNGPAASGRVLIARNDGANSSAWNNGAGGSASPILTLNADTLYFMEALMKEGGGGDHLEVALRPIDGGNPIGGLPGVNANEIVVGSMFVNMGNPDRAALTVAEAPPAEITVAENDTVTLRGFGYGSNFELSQATGYQWQRSDGLGGFNNIPGAVGPTLDFVAPASDTEYRLLVGGPGTNAVYSTVVHSSADTKAPFMISASSLNGTNLDVVFNEPLEPGSGVDPFNYTINDGVTPVILGIVQRDDPRKVTITVDAHAGGTFTIMVNGVADLAGNSDVSTVTGKVSSAFVALDVGTPVALGSTFGGAEGEFDVLAGGNDIWGTVDVGHLTLTPITGNFDVHVRVAGLTRPDPITKAGLMVRETLDANSRTLFSAVNPAQYQAPHAFNPLGLSGRDLGEAGHRYATGQATAAWAARPESRFPIQQGGGSAYYPVQVPNAWIRMKREGNLFTAMRSYDGVNWVAHAQVTFNYPRTVYVGFATTAHTAAQAPGLVTSAQYRDIYLPPAPIILVQPEPSVQTVPLHAAVSYSVTASNPPPNVSPLTYQWYQNGVAIPNATGTTLNIADATGANSGVYHVEVSNDGGTVSSVAVTLNVDTGLVANSDAFNTAQNVGLTISAASLLANDSAAGGDTPGIFAVSGVQPATYVSDFNNGIPAGAAIYGAAGGGFHDVTGGVNNSGVVKLTLNANNHAGALVINELAPNRRVTAFNASFMLRIGDGSAEPADGFSFNFAPDLQNTANTGLGENGVGNGISFCVDNYRFLPYPLNNNAIANTHGLKLRYRNQDIAGVRTMVWNSPRFVPVNVSVTPEGMLTVMVDGTNVFGTLQLPNYIPQRGRFGMYARNGGQNMSQWVDDLSITAMLTVETTREPAVGTEGARILGNAFINGGIMHVTDNINSQQGTFVSTPINSEALTSLTADFKLRIGGGTSRDNLGGGADGVSLSIAADLPNASWGEEGAGSYLTVSFDTWDNGTVDTAPAIDVKWGGVADANIIATKSLGGRREAGREPATPLLVDSGSQVVNMATDPPGAGPATFVPVSIRIDADGTLDLSYKGVPVFENLAIPGFFGATNVRVGVGGRTGGANDNHWIDDLVVNLTTASGTVGYTNDFNTQPPSPYGTVVLSGGNVIYTPPADVCGSDTFYYLMTGQSGGVAVGRVDVAISEGTPTPPTITACATNRLLAAGLNCLAALPDLRAELAVTDNCCCPTIVQDPPPGTLLARGTHTVTFTATDSAGLSAVCQATVTVTDQTGPVITLIGGSPLTVECHSTSQLPGATAQDDCDGDLTSSIVVSGSVDRNVPGSYTLTYNVSDLSGNAAFPVERIVNVVDTSAPSITCPAPIVTTCTGTGGGATVTFTVLVSDVCDSNVTAVCTPASGSHFPQGVTTVTCVATDASGNTNACSFTVTVNDTPALLTIERLGTNSVVLSWPQTCGQFILEQTDTLVPPAWAQAPGTPAIVNDRWTITLPTEDPRRFYRLRSSP